MMDRHRGFRDHRTSIPNLAPMVDVVMVILIFFMLGAGFALSEGVLSTRLPTQIGPGGAARVWIVPTVRIALMQRPDGGADILVMGKPLSENTPEALEALLRSKIEAGADPNGNVLVAPDPLVRYEQVIAVLDACHRAGMSRVQIAVAGDALQARD